MRICGKNIIHIHFNVDQTIAGTNRLRQSMYIDIKMLIKEC